MAPIFDQAVDAVVDTAFDGPAGHWGGNTPTYRSVQAALDAAPAVGAYRIGIRRGIYTEKLLIERPDVTLIGEDRDTTVLRFGAASGHLGPGGRRWTTWGCATVIVRARNFSARRLSIENSFDYPANQVKDVSDPSRLADPQAVALMIDTGADRTLLRQVSLRGYQDTLFVNAGRSCFDQVEISGHIDFIFGAGTAMFRQCDIVCRARPDCMPMGWITAPSTDTGQAHGLLFVQCRLLREATVPDGAFALGRPWHPTTQFADGRYADPHAIGQAIFVDCWMDAHIAAQGWDRMHGTAPDGGRMYFQPEDARFFEYHSAGPGARQHARRRQSGPTEQAVRDPASILGDWRPLRPR
ncbi:MAG: pectinesterase family protein [Rhodocyclaceae bacterium]